MNFYAEGFLRLREIGEGGGFGFEGGDGFDEPRDGERVAHAAGATDETQDTAFARQLDGDAHQRGNAGAVDLRDAVQDNDHSLRATLNHGFESVVELLRRLADSEPAVNFEYRNPSGFADVDFHGQPVSHGGASVYPELAALVIRQAGRHYTLEGKLHKANRSTSLQAKSGEPAGRRRIRKTNPGNENFKL